jgi:hypothetical protein
MLATLLATLLALALRLFPLSPPGNLSGDTHYDDGVYFGNALRANRLDAVAVRVL